MEMRKLSEIRLVSPQAHSVRCIPIRHKQPNQLIGAILSGQFRRSLINEQERTNAGTNMPRTVVNVKIRSLKDRRNGAVTAINGLLMLHDGTHGS